MARSRRWKRFGGRHIKRIAISLLIACTAWAADFESGQAARAVIGQNSFSSRESSITPTALSLGSGRLYVADASRRVLTYDLTQIPGAKDDLATNAGSACALCGFSPMASVAQSVLPGVASAASFGKTVAIADTVNHRVLVWRDATSSRAIRGPDVTLGRSGAEVFPISGATMVEPISVAYDGKRLFVGDGTLHRVLIWNSLPVSDNQPADVVLGQQNLASMNLADLPAPDTITRPAALASDGTNLFVADTIDHRILIFTAADTALPNNAVENSASSIAGVVAPGTLVTIVGRGFAETGESVPDGADQLLPNALGGVEVLLNGIALPLLSASPTQVRAQIPYDLGDASAGSLYIRTQHADGSVTTTNARTVKLTAASPGLFAFAGSEPRIGMILHTDTVSGQASAPVTSDNPAKPGEVLIAWAAGLGAVDSGDEDTSVTAGLPYDGPDAPVLNPIEAVAGERTAPVISATLPHGSIGIYEIRIQLPAGLPPDSKTPLSISQGDQVSNTVTIPVGIVQ